MREPIGLRTPLFNKYMPLNVPERDGSQVFWDSYASLQDPTNKALGKDNKRDGSVGELMDELTLDRTDEELLSLKTKWEKKSKGYTQKILHKQKRNEKYYMGNSFGSGVFGDGNEGAMNYQTIESDDTKLPLADNLIFQAVETFIPEVTKQSADPIIMADGTPDGEEYAKLMKEVILEKADQLRIRLKMKIACRFWSLLYLGPFQFGWDAEEDDMMIEPIDTKKLVFDPKGTVRFGEYDGEYMCIPKECSAKELIALYPNQAQYIAELVEGKMGTMIRYEEWLTSEMVFWTLKEVVLGKNKNPFFNYDQVQKQIVDPMGQVQTVMAPPLNHFTEPEMPFAFLSVFSLLRQPHDATGLVEQNLSNQDRLNKFLRQIDKNTDIMNGGWGISGDAFTLEQAANAVTALRAPDGVVWVPKGPVDNAIKKFSGQGLPNDIYLQVNDIREQLMGIFGVTGFTSQGVQSEQTVRGKIIVRGQDQGRSSGVSEFVEQLYDQIFNWMVQLITIRYEEKHLVGILGQERTARFIHLREMGIQLYVSVKEGSLIPKDPLTKYNQAMDLWDKQAIDPYSFYQAIDDPDPQQSTERLLLYKTNPIQYAQQFNIQPQMMPQQAATGGGQVQAQPPNAQSPEQAAIAPGVNPLSAVPLPPTP